MTMTWRRLTTTTALLAVVGTTAARASAEGPPPAPRETVSVHVSHADGAPGTVSVRDPKTGAESPLCALPCTSEVEVGAKLQISWGDGSSRSVRVRRPADGGHSLDMIVREEHSTLHYVGAGILTAVALGMGIVGGGWASASGSGLAVGYTNAVGAVVLGHGVLFAGIATAMFVTSGSRVDTRPGTPSAADRSAASAPSDVGPRVGIVELAFAF
ncbi:MAG: hypothetical protein JST00_33905 [Deltaproteobacteria bacterium]|nr:hypothetical protein [Deltaproteobacteria bacterium]